MFTVLSKGEPKSAKEIVSSTGLDDKKVWDSLYYWWKKGLLLRSEKPTVENTEVFKGRRGFSRNTRTYYHYVLNPSGKDSLHMQGQIFVPYQKKYLDVRG